MNEIVKAKAIFCRRADLLRLGLTDETIEALRFEVASADEAVPPRRIGYLRLPSKRAGGEKSRKGFYLLRDVAKIVGRTKSSLVTD